MKKYRFNKEKHLHQLLVDGEYRNLTGCTTILNVIAKPFLIQWSADMAVSEFGWIKDKEWDDKIGKYKVVSKEKRLEKVNEFLENLSTHDNEGFLEMLDKARVSHCKKKEKAGGYGDRIHERVSEIIQEAIDKNEGEILTIDDGEQSVQNFIHWALENKVKFISTEQNLWSEKMFIGGICDFVCEIDGQRWVSDIKTAKSGIYPENFWQVACYDMMFQEQGEPKADGYIILNLKENGKFTEKRSISIKENEDAFLACLKIYRIKEKMKNQVI